MEQRSNKTIVCSVFFLDIVEYSKKSVSGQISLKERFNAFLSIAIRDVPIGDRIILDTGDGAAISFLGDIEDALQAALSMRSSLLDEGVRMEPPLLVRMGINLGPVRLVKDINGQPNIVGDGINVAQRVMGFADPGQILVSRSYYDAVSRLSQEYAGMFHYQGSRTDKHVREHEVYAIGYPGDFTSTQRRYVLEHQAEGAQGLARFKIKTRQYWECVLSQLSQWEHHAIELFKCATLAQRVGMGSAAALILLLGGWGLYELGHTSDTQSPPQLESLSVSQALPPPVSGASAPVAASQVQAQSVDGHEKTVQGVKQSERIRTLAETTGGPAVVSLAIQPWGEVYLDGKLQGVSPPLLELQVVAGKHGLEIKNGPFPPYKQVFKAKSGAKIKIKHNFK